MAAGDDAAVRGRASPPGVDVKIRDDLYEDMPFDEPFDLVGLTCMSHQACAPTRSPTSSAAGAAGGDRRVPRDARARRAPDMPTRSWWARPRGSGPECSRTPRRAGCSGRYMSEKLSDLKGLPDPAVRPIDLKPIPHPQPARADHPGLSLCLQLLRGHPGLRREVPVPARPTRWSRRSRR